jgi:hypothetical protein
MVNKSQMSSSKLSSSKENEEVHTTLGESIMKFIVRAFVVVLALTGAAASTQISTASASTSNKVAIARTSMVPVPMCPPDDKNACGWR